MGGACNGYGTVLKTPKGYSMYYRATVYKDAADGSGTIGRYTSVVCMVESVDGISFSKPDLGLFEYNGTKHNNIVLSVSDRPIDSFSIFYDKNPACPPDEKFKALTEGWVELDGVTEPRLNYFASADGIHFTEKYKLDVRGLMDSLNPAFWDNTTEQYFLYYRAYHEKDGTDHLNWNGVDSVHSIRDVRVATSKDFQNWTTHGRIRFEEGQEDCSLYTNQITKYDRGENLFIGFPVRYCDRVADRQNFAHMPLADYREKIIEHYGRTGSALTDCVIMTSYDGFTFDRRDEAFLTPGQENSTNWWYGGCYTVYGLIETKSEEAGASNEISFFVGENYRVKNVNFRRYTMRPDGFFSWYAPYRCGEVLTDVFEADGERMLLNFATSAVGGITVSVCDADGNALDGYTSYVMFGDSVERPVEFEKALSDLKGQAVRLKFEMQDAHLYSYAVV